MMENIFHSALARFPTLGLIPDAIDILGPFIEMHCLKLKYEGPKMKKRCPVSTAHDLNVIHGQ